MEEIKMFHDAVAHPAGIASGLMDKKVMGYLCSYAPHELIHAAGFHPMRIFSSKQEISLADNHLQAYCCSPVRGVLEDSLAGRLDFLEGTVFPHTCDSIQRLSDIWRMKGRYSFFADVVMPAKLNTPSARIYMGDVLRRFREKLEKAQGCGITDRALRESMEKFNIIRRNLSRLYELRSLRPGLIRGSDMLAMVKGSMMMDVDLLTGLLPKIVDRFEGMDSPEKSAKRLVVSGGICDFPDFFDLLEEAGAVVVADDLCTGSRWFEGELDLDPDLDPMEALTSRYMDRLVCPAKHLSNTVRARELVGLAKKERAAGVVFLLLKFCDPHAFDYPYLKECLEGEGIRNILIEMDDQAVSAGQISTRLETFVYMISQGGPHE